MSATDPHRRAAAAHELGHYLALKELDSLEPGKPRIWGHGDNVGGEVSTLSGGNQTLDNEDDVIAYIACDLAGPAAEIAWAAQPGETRLHANACAIDEVHVRQMLRQATFVNRAQIERHALLVVQRNWHRIVELVPHLAENGTI
jgi:hypothetical protein